MPKLQGGPYYGPACAECGDPLLLLKYSCGCGAVSTADVHRIHWTQALTLHEIRAVLEHALQGPSFATISTSFRPSLTRLRACAFVLKIACTRSAPSATRQGG